MTDGEPPLMNEPVMRALMMITLQEPPTVKDATLWGAPFLHFLKRCLAKEVRSMPRYEFPLHPHVPTPCIPKYFAQPLKRALAEQLLMHPWMKSASPKDEFALYVAQRLGLA